MPSGVTVAEVGLIHSYRSVAYAPERATIISRYAEITHLSLGRAEDALDLWVHLRETARQTPLRVSDLETHNLFCYICRVVSCLKAMTQLQEMNYSLSRLSL